MSASVLEKAVVSKFVVSYDEIRVVGCGLWLLVGRTEDKDTNKLGEVMDEHLA